MEVYKKEVKRSVRIISIVLTLLLVVLMIYGIVNRAEIKEKLSSEIENYGISVLFATSLLLDLIPQLLSPVAALSVAIVTGINVHYAILSTVLGSAIGSVIGFILGKKYMFDAVDVLAGKKSIKDVGSLTNRYGKIIVPVAAISPLPYLPVLLGALNFSKRNFLIYGLIPRALGIIGFGYLVYLF